jgi:hypothetical protein
MTMEFRKVDFVRPTYEDGEHLVVHLADRTGKVVDVLHPHLNCNLNRGTEVTIVNKSFRGAITRIASSACGGCNLLEVGLCSIGSPAGQVNN